MLPVDPEWRCDRSGDCCREPPFVLMTEAEADGLARFANAHWTMAQLGRLGFSRDAPGFVRLHAKPCPFLEGRATCTVYDIRPYNCRRFGCFRPDVATEPFSLAEAKPYEQFATIGCANLRNRLARSRVARRMYALMQRKAQRWALQHGWSANDAGA